MKTVVAALIKQAEQDNKYLIAKRSTGNPSLIGKWEFPGGKVELNETDEAALEREIIEEFNTVIAVGKLCATAEIDREHLLKLYRCEHVLGPYRPSAHSEIKWLSLSEISSLDLAPADRKLLGQLLPHPKLPHLSELVIGNSYQNADIARIFCVSPQGGMRKSNRTNSLVLVVRHDPNNPYDDRWVDGEMHYTGMGLNGDQSIDYKQNKTLAESKSNGIDVHLFESHDRNSYIYRGKVALSNKPYYETQKDVDGRSRKVVKFPLKLIDQK